MHVVMAAQIYGTSSKKVLIYHTPPRVIWSKENRCFDAWNQQGWELDILKVFARIYIISTLHFTDGIGCI